MDDTMFDFVEPVLNQYNKLYTDSVKLSDIKDYNIHKFLKPECKNVFKDVVDDNFILGLKLMDGAKAVLDYLNDEYGLYFVTAGSPKTISARHQLLRNNFDWYTSHQLIRCEHKSIIDVDFLMDDCLSNFYDFKGGKYLFNRPWNELLPAYGIKRFYDWNQIGKFFNMGDEY